MGNRISLPCTKYAWGAIFLEFMLQNPNESVPKAIAAIQLFSLPDYNNYIIQQQIHCAHKNESFSHG